MMLRYQSDVRDFHERMNQPIGVFDQAGRLLRDSLIREETEETISAIGNRDMIETIDGLCDCLYVSVGAAVAFGFTLADYYPTCPEPDSGMREPQFIDPEEATSLLHGARKIVVAGLELEELATAIVSITGYVAIVFSIADRFNIPIRSFWQEVHRSNLAKAGGPTRADGKRMKPIGWTPPDLRGVYEELFGRRPT